MSIIKEAHAEYYRVPLREVLVDAVHGNHTHFELIICRIQTQDGFEGTGYTYTGGFGGHAIHSMLEHELIPFVWGRDADCIDALWNDMQWRVHYVARGGIASFAISAVDIALWDIRGRKSGQPLWKMAGGRGRSANVYVGGIDLNFSLDKLLDQTRKNLDRGFTSVKIKVGQKNLSDDIKRAVAVHNLLGDGFLMTDANMSWSVEKAIRAGRLLRTEANALWLEEPTIPEDYAGYNRIQQESGIAVAGGENLHTLYEHRMQIEQGNVDFPMPDSGNVGGITGFLKVAAIAQAFNRPVCTHGMQELNVSLMSGITNPGWVEAHSFPIDEYTTRPLVVENGLCIAPDTPGTGVEFDWAKLAPYKG